MNMLRCSFAKQVSDGQYGHERAEVVREIDEPECDAGQLLAELREFVHAELARSPSEAVRYAVTYRPRQEPGAASVPEDDVDDPADLPF